MHIEGCLLSSRFDSYRLFAALNIRVYTNKTLIRCGLLVAFTRVAVKCKKRKPFVYAQQRLKRTVGGPD